MTPAEKALEAGHIDLDSQYPETFQVDGLPGDKLGHLDNFTFGNVLTDQGWISQRTGELSFRKHVWTPLVGQMVTVQGLNLRVSNIHDNRINWTVILIESQQ